VIIEENQYTPSGILGINVRYINIKKHIYTRIPFGISLVNIFSNKNIVEIKRFKNKNIGRNLTINLVPIRFTKSLARKKEEYLPDQLL
jgi:hypothetical protein